MGSIERILVMGAGPGGLANAAVLVSQGSHVTLFNRSLDRLQGTIRRGGVEIEGSLGEAFVPVPKITDDIEDAMKDAQLILIVVPAYGHTSLSRLVMILSLREFRERFHYHCVTEVGILAKRQTA